MFRNILDDNKIDMYMFVVLRQQKDPGRLMEVWSTQGGNWE